MSQTKMNDTTNLLPAPVLLLTFNRFETAKQVFEAIKQAAPPRLYLASDGPRDSKPGEREKVEEIRTYLEQYITWPCEVKTLFRTQNLGCKRAVSSAIDWFFEHEERGIILEDDCLPSASFFRFCNELLEKYKDDTRIWQISGYNLLDGKYTAPASYVYTNFGFNWGWATWRRAWRYFDVDMKQWPAAKKERITETYPFMPSRNQIWEDTYNSKIDTWDYQWNFTQASNSGLSVVPVTNLIRNIGFGADATHTFGDHSGRGALKNQDISFPLVHPSFVIYDKHYESMLLARVSSEAGLVNRIKSAIRKRIKRVTKR
jgi:hypothetical protein